MDDTLVLLLIFGLLFLIVGIPLIKGISEYKENKQVRAYYKLQEEKRVYREFFLNKIEDAFKEDLSSFVSDLSDFYKKETDLQKIQEEGFQMLRNKTNDNAKVFNIFANDVKERVPIWMCLIGCYLFFQMKEEFDSTEENLTYILAEHINFSKTWEPSSEDFNFIFFEFAKGMIVSAVKTKIKENKPKDIERICI
jgi:hypothetical protein